MPITPEAVESQLKGLLKNRNLDMDKVVLVKHKEVPERLVAGFKKLGEVADTAPGETGTLVAMERPSE